MNQDLSPSPRWRFPRWIFRTAARAWRRCLESRIDPGHFERRLSLWIDQAVKWGDRFR